MTSVALNKFSPGWGSVVTLSHLHVLAQFQNNHGMSTIYRTVEKLLFLILYKLCHVGLALMTFRVKGYKLTNKGVQVSINTTQLSSAIQDNKLYNRALEDASLFPAVSILWVLPLCVYSLRYICTQLRASHNPPCNYIVMRQRGNLSNNDFSRYLVGTLTSHWGPPFMPGSFQN